MARVLALALVEHVQPLVEARGVHEGSHFLPLGPEGAHGEGDHLRRRMPREGVDGGHEPEGSVVGVQEDVGLRDVSTVRRILDDELCAGAVGVHQQGGHARHDVVGTLELLAVRGRHET